MMWSSAKAAAATQCKPGRNVSKCHARQFAYDSEARALRDSSSCGAVSRQQVQKALPIAGELLLTTPEHAELDQRSCFICVIDAVFRHETRQRPAPRAPSPHWRAMHGASQIPIVASTCQQLAAGPTPSRFCTLLTQLDRALTAQTARSIRSDAAR